MRRRYWAAIALIVAVAGAGLWLTARRIAPAPPSAAPVPPNIQAKFEGITVRGRSEGDRRWELEADSIQVTKDQTLTHLDGLRRATLYSGAKPLLSVRAKWANLRSPSHDLELGGGVELKSTRDLVMRTDSLRWAAAHERLASGGAVEMAMGDTKVRAARAYYLAQSEQIVCDGGVRIRQGENFLTGSKLTADLRAETLEVAGGVRMRMRVAEGREFSGNEGPLGAMKGLLEKAPKEAR